MAHRRNVDGLRQHAQKKRLEAIQRTDEAIRLLLQEQRLVSFKIVAEIAGVTTAWLYREENIKQRIFHLRQQPGSQKQTLQVKAPASEASKDQIISALKTRVKELNEEVRDLKQRLEIVYGELVSSQQQLRAREGKSGSKGK
jgi:uncharacterized protein YceH (UPF0502 family)